MDPCAVRFEAAIGEGLLAGQWDAIVVAVSGGADSVALLELARQSQARQSHRLVVCHVHHGLRGAEADRDAAFVGGLAARNGLPFYLERVDVPRALDSTGESVETAARRLRYEALGRVADRLGTCLVLVAHHRDDQVETVLDRVIRGSGIRGLGGMAKMRPLGRHTLFRPLLGFSRADLEAFSARQGLSHVQDASNESFAHRRNRIRLELLPYLRERFNEQVDESILRLAAIARVEDGFMAQAADDAARGMIRFCGRWADIELERFRSAPCALQRRIVKLVLEGLAKSAPVRFIDVERIRRTALGERIGQATLSGGLRIRGLPGVLRIERLSPSPRQVREWDAAEVPWSGRLVLADGLWQVLTRPVEPPLRMAPDRWEAFFSRARGDEFRFRPWRRGDRVRPLGLGGSKLVSDVFIDAKVDRAKREGYPVLVLAGEILWVPGLCRSGERLVRGDEPVVQYISVAPAESRQSATQ